jgi:hypothetical protein
LSSLPSASESCFGSFLPNSIIMDTKKLSSKTCLWPSNFFSSYVISSFSIVPLFFRYQTLIHLRCTKESQPEWISNFKRPSDRFHDGNLIYCERFVLSLIINLMINI